MTWWALDVRTAPASHDAVASWLVSKTGQAVEERDDGMVIGFAPSEEAARTLEHELSGIFSGVSISLRDVEPVDWSTRWRDGIQARRLGRLTLTPSWLATPGPSAVRPPWRRGCTASPTAWLPGPGPAGLARRHST